MFWLEVSIITPKHFRRQIENMIAALGGSVKESGVESGIAGEITIAGYFPVEARTGDTFRLLRARVANVLGSYPDITFAEVHGADPTTGCRRVCSTFQVGERLVVKPSWETYQARKGEVVIDQDPSLAFGCGTHPTVALALEFLERYLRKGTRVFDVGTGSGILAVAAAKLGASEVFAIDVDPVAIEIARETVAQNNLQGRITIIEGNLLENLPGSCDLMLVNIYPHLLEDFIPVAYPRIVPGGSLIVTGFTASDEGLVTGLLRGVGFQIDKAALRGKWVAMVAHRAAH